MLQSFCAKLTNFILGFSNHSNFEHIILTQSEGNWVSFMFLAKDIQTIHLFAHVGTIWKMNCIKVEFIKGTLDYSSIFKFKTPTH